MYLDDNNGLISEIQISILLVCLFYIFQLQNDTAEGIFVCCIFNKSKCAHVCLRFLTGSKGLGQ